MPTTRRPDPGIPEKKGTPPPPQRGLGPVLGEMASDLMDATGEIMWGDDWPRVREEQRMERERRDRAQARRDRMEAVGIAVAIVFLACLAALMVAGTIVAVRAILG